MPLKQYAKSDYESDFLVGAFVMRNAEGGLHVGALVREDLEHEQQSEEAVAAEEGALSEGQVSATVTPEAPASKVYECHLAGHEEFRFDEAQDRPDGAWAPCPLPDLRAGILRDMFIAIGRHPSSKKMPYSYHSAGLTFSPSGEWLNNGVPGEGVTCSTFIVAVFKSCAIPFILEASWPPPSEGDKRRRKKQAETYLAAVATPKHAAAAAIAPFRYRAKPEEIGVAVGLMNPAEGMSYKVIEPRAAKARALMDSIAPKPAKKTSGR